MVVPDNRIHFHGNYIPQNWSIPDSFIYYITKKPSNPFTYKKVIKTCKYFFFKNPLIVVPYLRYCGSNKWEIFINHDYTIDIDSFNHKIWLSGCWDAHLFIKESNIVSSLTPKIYLCNARLVNFSTIDMSYNELLFLSSNVRSIKLFQITVKYDDGSIVSFEKIVEIFPKIENMDFKYEPFLSSITVNTVKELVKIPHFLKMKRRLRLINIPETFDLDAFYDFMKKNKRTQIRLYFAASLSEAYKIRLEKIIDEIIATKSYDYRKPYITFPELDVKKDREIYHAHYGSYCTMKD